MSMVEKPLHERFKSGFKISFRNNNPIVSRGSILRALSKLKAKLIDEVNIITKYEHNNSWLVIVKDEVDCSELNEKSIIVTEGDNSYYATIRPLNEKYLYRRYKLIWNPFESETMISKIFEKIDRRIEVREVDFERCKEKGLEKIYNGNTMILIRIKKEIRDEISIKDGAIEVEGTKMFLSRIGGPVRCHKCGELGHYFVDCKISEDSYKSKLMIMRRERNEDKTVKDRERSTSKTRDGKMDVGLEPNEQYGFTVNGDVSSVRRHGEKEETEEGDEKRLHKKYKEGKAGHGTEETGSEMCIKYFQIDQ